MRDARDLHRPDDRDQLAREAIRLRATGLSVFDIASALRLPIGAAKSLLPSVFDALNTSPMLERNLK